MASSYAITHVLHFGMANMLNNIAQLTDRTCYGEHVTCTLNTSKECDSLVAVDGLRQTLEPGPVGQSCLSGHGGAAGQDLLCFGSRRHLGND